MFQERPGNYLNLKFCTVATLLISVVGIIILGTQKNMEKIV